MNLHIIDTTVKAVNPFASTLEDYFYEEEKAMKARHRLKYLEQKPISSNPKFMSNETRRSKNDASSKAGSIKAQSITHSLMTSIKELNKVVGFLINPSEFIKLPLSIQNKYYINGKYEDQICISERQSLFFSFNR